MPPVTREKEAASQLLAEMTKLGAGVETMTTRLKEMSAKVEGLEKLDIKKALEEFDRLKTGFEELKRQVRLSKTGLWFPGVEDAGKKFSLLRAIIAHKTGEWDKCAPYEKEVIEEARKAAERVKAGHVVGTDSSGGTFIPDQVLDDVIPSIYTKSVIAALDPASGQTRATVLDGLFGMPVKIPRAYGGAIAYMIDEEEEFIESNIRTGVETMQPKKMGVLVSLTDEMRRFAAPVFDTMIRNDMVRAASKKLDWLCFYGTGTDASPLGLANMPRHGSATFPGGGYKPGVNHYYVELHDGGPGVSAPVSPVGGEANFDDLMNMQGVIEDLDLEVDESWAWISHARFFRRMRQLKVSQYSGQTDKFSYLLGAPMISKQRLTDLIGDWAGTTQIPTTNSVNNVAKFGDVFGGNWRQLMIGRWSGVEIVSDEGKGKGFTSDVTYAKLRVYLDIKTREEREFVLAQDARMRD